MIEPIEGHEKQKIKFATICRDLCVKIEKRIERRNKKDEKYLFVSFHFYITFLMRVHVLYHSGLCYKWKSREFFFARAEKYAIILYNKAFHQIEGVSIERIKKTPHRGL